MIEKLTLSVVPEGQRWMLLPLWQSCFPEDTEEFVRSFLRNLPPQTDCLCGRVGETAVTMLFLIPATVTVSGAVFRARYLYGGGTHPGYRHRGFYAQLMAYAARRTEQRGEAGIYLHPAENSLLGMYKAAGYLQTYYGYECLLPDGIPGQAAVSCTTEVYSVRRRERLQEICVYGYAATDQQIERFWLEDECRNGGKLLLIGTGVACVRQLNGKCTVKELLCPPAEIAVAFSYLRGLLPVNTPVMLPFPVAGSRRVLRAVWLPLNSATGAVGVCYTGILGDG